MPQNRAAHHRRFLDHAERDAYLLTFVADYNRTRLRCLDYQAPAELIAKLAGHNTEAGFTREVLKADGLQAAADRLGISLTTARTHLAHVFDKTGARGQAKLVRLIPQSQPTIHAD
jgi:DNA-binding CsgD family transcriptional regulator